MNIIEKRMFLNDLDDTIAFLQIAHKQGLRNLRTKWFTIRKGKLIWSEHAVWMSLGLYQTTFSMQDIVLDRVAKYYKHDINFQLFVGVNFTG